MKIIFVRHGQTDENAAGRYLGHSNPSLNDTGRQQIDHFTKIFPKCFSDKITSFYCSDLKRTRETAKLIEESLKLEQPTFVSALREIQFGDWELMTYEEIMEADLALATAWIDNPYELAPPNGETLMELGDRFDDWFEKLLMKSNQQDNILIVCHGGPIRWFRSKWLLGDSQQFWNLEGIKHGTGIVVEYEKETKEFMSIGPIK
jgi:alpha-ribazole phosphatase